MDTILCVIVGIVLVTMLIREKVNQVSLQDNQNLKTEDAEGNQENSGEEGIKNILKEFEDKRDGSYAFEDDAYDIHKLQPLLNTIAYISCYPNILEKPSPFRDSILASPLICSWLAEQPRLLSQLPEEVLGTIHKNAK